METSKSNIDQLPLELFLQVNQYLDIRDRHSLRLASRACTRGGLQCLLQQVHVHFKPRSLAHLSALSQIPTLADHVRSLIVHYPKPSPDNFSGAWLSNFMWRTSTARGIALRYSAASNEPRTIDSAPSTSETDSWIALKDPLACVSSVENYGGVPKHQLIQDILRSALPNLRNLEKIRFDSEQQVIEWAPPNRRDSVHSNRVWLRPGGEGYDYAGLLRYMESCHLKTFTRLQVRPEPGYNLNHAGSFGGCMGNIGHMIRWTSTLDVKMPTIAPPRRFFDERFIIEIGITPYDSLSDRMELYASEIFSDGFELEELSLQFSYDFDVLFQSSLNVKEYFPHGIPLIRLDWGFHLSRIRQLRRLSIGSFSTSERSFSTSERSFMEFLLDHRSTLRDLSLADVRITHGSWASWFRGVREKLDLEHAEISEPLCEAGTGILLRFGDASTPDRYGGTIGKRFWQPAEFGERLGRICTVHTPLNGVLRCSTLALLEQCFTVKP